MSAIELRNRDRIIEELKVFIKRVLVEPEIAPTCLKIARELANEPDANRLIAEKIAATTSVKIPAVQSDADKLFLELLKDVVRDEKALY